MAGQELTVVARMRARQGKEEQLEAGIRRLIGPTRAEEGCINYDLHRSQNDPRLFFLYETWASRGDLDHHFATPHLQEFLGLAPDLLEGEVDISFWDMI